MLTRLYQILSTTKTIAWLWSLLIIILCSIPAKSIPDAPIAGFDKIVHVGLFVIWSILWLLATQGKIIQIIVLGVIFGIGIEIYQQLMPLHRTFDWWDALADAVGILLGYLIKKILDRYLQRLY